MPLLHNASWRREAAEGEAVLTDAGHRTNVSTPSKYSALIVNQLYVHAVVRLH